jgi:hypothetical protein
MHDPYLNIEFISSSSLVVNFKLRVKENIRSSLMLLFYVFQTNNVDKICVFFDDLLPFFISGS